MFPEPTELLLIGYLIESIWAPNPNQIHWHQKPTHRHANQGQFHTWWMESSFCVCLTLAISVQPIVLKWCRKERKKIQVKKESQQNRNRWWIWSRDAAKGLLTCYLLLHQRAGEKPDMKVNLIWARNISSIMERRDPLYTHTHQATLFGTLMKLGLLKSGNLINWWKIEQRDLL